MLIQSAKAKLQASYLKDGNYLQVGKHIPTTVELIMPITWPGLHNGNIQGLKTGITKVDLANLTSLLSKTFNLLDNLNCNKQIRAVDLSQLCRMLDFQADLKDLLGQYLPQFPQLFFKIPIQMKVRGNL